MPGEIEMAFDTHTITLHEDDAGFPLNDDFDWSQPHVEAVVKHAFDNTAVGAQSNFRSFGETQIVAGNDTSRVAYVETDSGYFVVSADMMSHVIVTYSRWD
jgi:hypothetical protein